MLDNAENNATALKCLETLLTACEKSREKSHEMAIHPFNHLKNCIRCYAHIINLCSSHVILSFSSARYDLNSTIDDDDDDAMTMAMMTAMMTMTMTTTTKITTKTTIPILISNLRIQHWVSIMMMRQRNGRRVSNANPSHVVEELSIFSVLRTNVGLASRRSLKGETSMAGGPSVSMTKLL